MGNFNRGGRSDRGQNFERRGFNDRGRDKPVIMHSAVCGKCGKNCEVPFRPTGERPVFCSDCFENNRNSERSSDFSDRQMFEAVCAECGNTCKVPFQPSNGKPVYCSNCFGEKKEGPARSREQFKPQPQYDEQFRELNSKLDKILSVLNPNPQSQDIKEEIAEEVKELQQEEQSEEQPEEQSLDPEIKVKASKSKTSKKK
jgi:CxxC-x17-CxxC domain-containing protein